MLYDSFAKLLWNTQFKNKILSWTIYHGYKYKENKFCSVLQFKKLALGWVEVFRPVSEENISE